MISNFLNLGTQAIYFFPQQKSINIVLLIAVFIAIPSMLCVKPCVMGFCVSHKHDEHDDEENFEKIEAGEGEDKDKLVENDEPDSAAEIRAYEKLLKAEHGPQGAHGVTFGDLFIHQMIETIEFVLGAVSNTASYLRLWALSLAHSQLAGVFLEFGLSIGWRDTKKGGPNTNLWSITFMTFILWFAYMAVTWGVLMMMDVLECFLHTLRLHWVEFQNKFYGGTGYLYTPFRFKDTFEAEMARK